MDRDDLNELHELHGMQYGHETMRWYGWGSPVGLSLFLLAIGGFIYLLHLAGLIG